MMTCKSEKMAGLKKIDSVYYDEMRRKREKYLY